MTAKKLATPEPEQSQTRAFPPKMADDPVCGPIRHQIMDEYIAAGQPGARVDWLYSRLVEARRDAAKVRESTAREIARKLRERAKEIVDNHEPASAPNELTQLANKFEREYGVTP